MKSSSATEASLAMLTDTIRDKNSKERKSLIETYKKLIARTIIIILLHFYFIINTLVSYAPVNPKRRPTKGTLLFKKSKNSNGNKTLLLFDPYSNCWLRELISSKQV